VEKFSEFYISKTGGDFVAKFLGFVVTARPMLRDWCPVCRVLLFVCDIVVLSPNGWMGQDATWCGGRHRSRPHYVRWGSSFPYRKRHSSGPWSCLLWSNGRPSQQLLSSCFNWSRPTNFSMARAAAKSCKLDPCCCLVQMI